MKDLEFSTFKNLEYNFDEIGENKRISYFIQSFNDLSLFSFQKKSICALICVVFLDALLFNPGANCVQFKAFKSVYLL